MRITRASGGVPSSLTVPLIVLAPIGAGGGAGAAPARPVRRLPAGIAPPPHAPTTTVSATNVRRTRTR